MSDFTRLLSLLAAMAAGRASLPQGICLAEGAANTSLDLRVVPEATPTVPGTTVLQAVEFLPIDHAGRSAGQALRADVARRIERNGITRIELPGAGRLFGYRRLGGQHWGFLHVPPDGMARVALELPGTGTTGTASPFLDRIGIAPDGRHAVVPLAGTGFHVLRLDGGTFVSTGTAARFVATASTLVNTSTMVGRSHLFCVTHADRVLRCQLADGGTPTDVTPPMLPGDRLKPELALSGDGSTAVFLLGPQNLQRLWFVDETTAPHVLPPIASKYEEPNYLPEGSGQSDLLLNHDGTRLFYIDSSLRDELHLLDTTAVLPDLQITENAIFQPYIGIHILPSFLSATLVVAIGDLSRMDWFRATLSPLGGSVLNLTGTGSLVQPFPAGTIDPLQAGPSANGVLLATETAPGAGTLRRVDPVAGTSAVLYTDVTAPLAAGSSFAGVADLVVKGAGDRLFRGVDGSELAGAPPGVQIMPPNRGPQFSATFVHLTGGFGMMAFYMTDGTVLAGPLEAGISQLCMTAGGGCVVNGTTLRYLAPGVLRTIPVQPAAVRICLSGAGG